MKKLERLQKYAEGGRVVKLQSGGLPRIKEIESLDMSEDYANSLVNPILKKQMLDEIEMQRQILDPQSIKSSNKYLPQTQITPQISFEKDSNGNYTGKGTVTTTETEVDPDTFFKEATETEKVNPSKVKGNTKFTLSGGAASAIGEVAVGAINAVDTATMGDKNFSASSQAIDTTVHGVSGALIKSGNPWAIGAGVALEGLNWLTKAGGRTVQGYDVDIKNSGYGNISHQESESGRIWDKWSGATARKLAKRNEKARMALAAMDISNDVEYEQEARQNSVTNVLQQNQIALSGGIDTSLLGS